VAVGLGVALRVAASTALKNIMKRDIMTNELTVNELHLDYGSRRPT
jgi:hypothetical protein